MKALDHSPLGPPVCGLAGTGDRRHRRHIGTPDSHRDVTRPEVGSSGALSGLHAASRVESLTPRKGPNSFRRPRIGDLHFEGIA